MIFTSTINPQFQTSGSLIVLSYEGRQRFIPTPESYEELQFIAMDRFSLGPTDDFYFETATLDVCRGEDVRVDEHVWALLAHAVGCLTVVCTGFSKDLGIAAPHDHVPPTPFSESSCLSSISEESEVGHEDEECGDESRDHHTQTEIHVDDFLTDQMGEVTLAPSADVLSAVDSAHEGDTETENHRVPVQAISLNEKSIPRHDAHEHFAESQPEGSIKAKERSLVRTPTIEPGLAPSPYDAQHSSQPESQLSQMLGDDDSPRFLISIEHATKGCQMFKTRGRHPTSKVLAGVCKAFGLKQQGARLILIIEVDDGDEAHMVCHEDDTMALTGATEGSRFIVEGEFADEDDDDE